MNECLIGEVGRLVGEAEKAIFFISKEKKDKIDVFNLYFKENIFRETFDQRDDELYGWLSNEYNPLLMKFFFARDELRNWNYLEKLLREMINRNLSS